MIQLAQIYLAALRLERSARLGPGASRLRPWLHYVAPLVLNSHLTNPRLVRFERDRALTWSV